MYKFVRKFLLFFLLFISILYVSNKSLPSYWGNEVIYKKMKQLESERNIVNTIFIGTSRVHSHINPKLYDELVKNSYSFNIGSPGASGLETTRIVDEIIKSSDDHEIKTIYSEIPSYNIPPRQNSESIRANYFYDFKSLRKSIQFHFNKKISLNKKLQLLPRALKLYFKNLFHLGLFKSVVNVGSDFHFSSEKIKPTPNRGFNELKRTIKKVQPLKSRLDQAVNFYNSVEKGIHITENSFLTKTLLNNITKAKKHGIKLVYVLFPKLPLKKYEENYFSLLKLPAKNALNLSNPEDYPSFYAQQYSADKAHLNFMGAGIITTDLAKHTNIHRNQ